VNYIFHKLSRNTKHVKLQLHMSPEQSFFKLNCRFIFLISFEEPLCTFTWLKLPNGWRVGCRKKTLIFHRILNFHFLFNSCFCSRFHMMSSSLWLLWFECDLFDFFNFFLQIPKCWRFESRPPQQKEFYLTHVYKSKDGIWAMCTQLDLEVIC
jgi:hypothetical protein